MLVTGGNIMKDVAKGRSFRKSLEKRGKQGGVELLNKVKTRMGRGQNRKRRSVIKDSDHSRSKKRRVTKEAKGIYGGPAFLVRLRQPMQVYFQRYYQLHLTNRNLSLRMTHKLQASSN